MSGGRLRRKSFARLGIGNHTQMFWLIFTAVDIYIGLIVLDQTLPSLPAEKQPRVKLMKKALIASLIAVVIMIFLKWIRK